MNTHKGGNKVFLSTPSARRATGFPEIPVEYVSISIHALREEGDRRQDDHWVQGQRISIHALREEGDHAGATTHPGTSDFYPRPPRGGRPCLKKSPLKGGKRISIHALREEGDVLISPTAPATLISIHALREEGDVLEPTIHDASAISIHALREEGDSTGMQTSCRRLNFYPRPPRGGRPSTASAASSMVHRFLSTPSARRATDRAARGYKFQPISIHALREEGDASSQARPTPGGYFYPRPPRGGRRNTCTYIHLVAEFLSTPSARRATS